MLPFVWHGSVREFADFFEECLVWSRKGFHALVCIIACCLFGDILLSVCIGRPDSTNVLCPDKIGRDGWDRGGRESVECFVIPPKKLGDEALAEKNP